MKIKCHDLNFVVLSYVDASVGICLCDTAHVEHGAEFAPVGAMRGRSRQQGWCSMHHGRTKKKVVRWESRGRGKICFPPKTEDSLLASLSLNSFNNSSHAIHCR